MMIRALDRSILGFILVVTAGVSAVQLGLGHESKFLLNCPADEYTVIRFFYHPADEDYYRFPLVFRAVGKSDSRLNTAPVMTEGRTVYISSAEMHDLIEALTHSSLSWEESRDVQVLGSYKQIPLLANMEILVVCVKGTARAELTPKGICKTLEPMDAALKTPRALWEFQLFRQGYRCKVPGFDFQAYPDH